MYLTRIFLNPYSRQAQSEAARSYQMHKTLLKAFPTPLPENERVLFRLEEHPRSGGLMVLVQSQTVPNWSILPETYLLPTDQLPGQIEANPEVKLVDLHVSQGQFLAFRLLANPTVKRAGKRHALYRADEQNEWLKRKLETVGAQLGAVNIAPVGKVKGYQTRGTEKNTLTHYGVRFDGTLCIADVDRFLEAIQQGIGPGKSMGFGLLSVASAG